MNTCKSIHIYMCVCMIYVHIFLKHMYEAFTGVHTSASRPSAHPAREAFVFIPCLCAAALRRGARETDTDSSSHAPAKIHESTSS